jgi:hypothetical protein
MWKEPLRGRRLVWTEGSPLVGAYAVADPGLRIVLVNRDTAPRSVEVTVTGAPPSGPGIRRVLSGSGPTDRKPVIRESAAPAIRSGRLAADLDPVSITVLEFLGTGTRSRQVFQ